MKISYEVIKRLGACWTLHEWRAAFGELTEVDVTPTNAREFAGKVNWSWLAAELLTREGYDKYVKLISRASDKYYADRTKVRDEFPFPPGVPYRERQYTEVYADRQRRLNAVREELNFAHATAFVVVYTDEREYSDSVIEWASKDSQELGPQGARQYRYVAEDDDHDDYDDFGDDVVTD